MSRPKREYNLAWLVLPLVIMVFRRVRRSCEACGSCSDRVGHFLVEVFAGVLGVPQPAEVGLGLWQRRGKRRPAVQPSGLTRCDGDAVVFILGCA